MRWIYNLIMIPLFALNVYAQDSTFSITLAAEILLHPDACCFVGFTIEDMDWDGNLEIIYSANVLTDEHEDMHAVGIIRNGEHIFLSEFQPALLRNNFVLFADLDGDNRRDIAVETSVPFRTFEIFSGPDFELTNALEYCFDSNGGVSTGDVWRNTNGEYEPVFIHDAYTEASGGNWSCVYCQSGIFTGSPVDGYPQLLSHVCGATSMALKSRDNGQGTDYFLTGRTQYRYYYDSGNGTEETLIQYRLMQTSHNNDLQDPDSLTVYYWDDTNEAAEDSVCGWVWSKYSVVEDLDNDGDLEWIVPHFNVFSEDTTFNYVQIYDPADFTLESEITIASAGIPRSGTMPWVFKGVKAIDVDRDGDWELMAHISDEPLYVIDPNNMEVIIVSDIDMPHNLFNMNYEIGHFVGEGDNLQVLVQTHLDRLLIYNLPEEWTNYYEVDKKTGQTVYNYRLYSAFPNPFNSTTTITYSMPVASQVSVKVFDLSGREIKSLIDGYVGAGEHSVSLSGNGMASGMYLVRMDAGRQKQVRKVLLVR